MVSWRRWLALWALPTLIGVMIFALYGVASASHCRPTGSTAEKDHLADGSCGYFVEPVSSPSPSSTPSPQPTGTPTPTPIPQVRVRNDGGHDLHVTVDNFPTPDPGASSQGWTAEDRAMLRTITEQQFTTHNVLVWAFGLVLVCLGYLTVMVFRSLR